MSARSVINQGLEEALATMEFMLVNEGQQTVFESYVRPEFRQNAQASVFEGWSYVSCDPYCDFMGETVETGNAIMENAYEQAILEVVEDIAF